jgi:hypothetical protein
VSIGSEKPLPSISVRSFSQRPGTRRVRAAKPDASA